MVRVINFSPLSVVIDGVQRFARIRIKYETPDAIISDKDNRVVGYRSKSPGCIVSITGDFYNCSGQIYNELMKHHDKWIINENFTKGEIAQILRIWQRWHMNDMNAGTEKQEEFLREWKAAGNKYSYEAACEALKAVGLYYDTGCTHTDVPLKYITINGKRVKAYQYGSAWVGHKLPEYVTVFLKQFFRRHDNTKLPTGYMF